MAPNESLTQKERIEHLRWLSDGAWERFKNRRAIEWKLYYSIWGAYGGAAYLVYSRESSITFEAWIWLIIIGAVPVLGLVMGWLPWIQRSHALDQKVSYFWSASVEHELNAELPKSLQPPSYGTPWPRPKRRSRLIQSEETECNPNPKVLTTVEYCCGFIAGAYLYREFLLKSLVTSNNWAVVTVTASFFALMIVTASSRIKDAASETTYKNGVIQKIEVNKDGKLNIETKLQTVPASKDNAIQLRQKDLNLGGLDTDVTKNSKSIRD